MASSCCNAALSASRRAAISLPCSMTSSLRPAATATTHAGEESSGPAAGKTEEGSESAQGDGRAGPGGRGGGRRRQGGAGRARGGRRGKRAPTQQTGRERAIPRLSY